MSQIDVMLRALENPTRRRILRRLTSETHYPLQLAKELRISPQAVMKHLEVLEKSGLVKCQRFESNMGPSRKCYTAIRHISLRVEMSPNLFEARIIELPDEEGDVRAKGEEIGDRDELLPLQRRLREIDRQIGKRDKELFNLIQDKERELDRANRIIRQFFEGHEEREILYHLLSHEEYTLSGISESLGLREEMIRRVLERLSEMGLVPK